MSITSPLLQLPISQFKSLNLTTTFLHGSSPLTNLTKPSSSSSSSSPKPAPAFLPTIRALKTIQGRVVCSTNDKTVAVEVVRQAKHPKYKRRIRIKTKFQAHDPENQFKVGDYVQLEKIRPISKTKAFLAIPAPPRNQPKPKKEKEELGIPLESQQNLG